MSDKPTRETQLDPRLDALSDAKRALLARRLAERAAAARPAPIPRRPDPRRAPLSAAQEEAWLLEARSERLTAYNLPSAWRVRGPLDEGALRRALDRLVERHESLRTTFALGADGPEQLIGAPRAVPLEVVDGHGASDVLDTRAIAQVEEWARRPFDLSRDTASTPR